MPVELEQMAHLSERLNKQSDHCDEVVNVDNNSQNPDQVDNLVNPPVLILGESGHSTKSKEVNQDKGFALGNIQFSRKELANNLLENDIILLCQILIP